MCGCARPAASPAPAGSRIVERKDLQVAVDEAPPPTSRPALVPSASEGCSEKRASSNASHVAFSVSKPKQCKRPRTATTLPAPIDEMGIDLVDGTLLRGVKIRLGKRANVDVGGSACVFLEDVVVEGGGISIGGDAHVTLVNVTVRGGDAALSVGGGASVVVEGGSYVGRRASIEVGGDAIASVHAADVTGDTAMSIGGAAQIFVDGARVGCAKASSFDECVSVGGSALVHLRETDVDAEGRAVSVGGDAHVLLDGGSYTTRVSEQIEMATVDVMGSADLVLRDVAIHGKSRAAERGGGGTLEVESGTFDPPLPAALCR